jgi:hypothetical protein
MHEVFYIFTGHWLAIDPDIVLFCLHCYQLLTFTHLIHCSKCSTVPQFSLYNVGTDRMENTAYSNGLNCWIHICCCRNVFIKPLPRSGHLFWLHCSSFSAAMSQQNTPLSHCLLSLWLVRPVESSCQHSSDKRQMHMNPPILGEGKLVASLWPNIFMSQC